MNSGKYEYWYPNEQLNVTGNYFNNQKEGEFKLFDETGNLMRTGNYQKGKLISGDAVVESKVFENPDKPASFRGGLGAFNDYLKSKTSQLQVVKEIPENETYLIDLIMTIAETGKLMGIDVFSSPNNFDNEVLSAAFGRFPGFIPASVENIPVKSIQSMGFLVSNEGIQQIAEDNDAPSEGILDSAEVMPQFPGGEIALQKYLCATVKYPAQAAEQGIQGKVHVTFIVFNDGSIKNAHVISGVHPLVDAEALRVIQIMPRWIPARVNGKPVRVKFTVPINFVLQDSN